MGGGDWAVASLQAVDNSAPGHPVCLALVGMRAREKAGSPAAEIEVDFADLTRLAGTMRALNFPQTALR